MMDAFACDIGKNPAAFIVEGLCWGPDRRAPVIHDIDLAVRPGEMLAVVGPNGAGKSSLLRCLYRFYRPTCGRIFLDGQDLWSLPPRAVARRVAVVLQEIPADFGLSVAEIVALGRTPRGDRPLTGRRPDIGVAAALAALGVASLAERTFASLSGGEKQRVMIARALARQPDMIILDEPTNHLDIRCQLEVLELLAHLPATVIISLHDLALASAHADRVLVLEKGRAIQCGAPLEVLTPSVIRRTFDVEAEIDRHPVTGRPRFSFHIAPPEEGALR